MAYATRVLPIKNHPVRKTLLQYYPYDFYRHQRRTLPTIGLMHNEFIAINLTYTSIQGLTPEMLFPITTPTIDLTLHPSKKSDLPPKAWQVYFKDLRLLYPTRTPVFCDGSKTAERTAAGSWSTDFNLVARLNKSNSIFTAELFAIFITLKYLESKDGLFILASDSLSSLKALQHAHSKSHYLVLKITQLLAVTQNKFILAWVPSHMGIEGNELADKIAQEALLLPHALPITLSDQELKEIISTHYHSQWQHQWQNSSAKLLPYKNTLGLSPYLDLKRSHQVPLTRLRLGATRLTHAHLFTGQQPAHCPSCNQRWTAAHLLLECPLLQQPRQPLDQHCKEMNWPFTLTSLLGDDFPAEKLVTFLSKTDIIDKL